MAIFELAIDKTLKWEGGYSNDPDDNGGETYRGISRVHNPNWDGWAEIDAIEDKEEGDIFPQLEDNVRAYYKKHYWDKIRLNEIADQRTAGFLFDFYVHSGANAVKQAQHVAGTTVDGIMGHLTRTAINKKQGMFDLLKVKRIAYLRSLNKPKYINGWLNRVASFT